MHARFKLLEDGRNGEISASKNFAMSDFTLHIVKLAPSNLSIISKHCRHRNRSIHRYNLQA